MSQDIGKALLAKTDIIIESWIEEIRQDADIDSSKNLAHNAVRNSIPLIVEAIATLLSDSLHNRPHKLEDNGLEHGVVRAKQGYDVAEVVREYGLLREIIFAVLESDLLTNSKKQIFESMRLIDSVIDRVIALSLDKFVAARLTELKQLYSQLLLTNQELTRLIATQKEDLSHLAHELKSPLNSIMGFSSLLLQQQQKIQQGQDNCLNLQLTEKVISNSKQLLRLINDTLEISRYEAGKVELNLKYTDLRSLVLTVKEALEPFARQKNIEIIFESGSETEGVLQSPNIQTDPLRLRQIITNLLSNAVRYTESGTITITYQTNDNSHWSLAIADTGVGIDPIAQKRIFEPYFRVAGKEDYAANSTGLGLAIVKRLVTLLEGNIDLVSELNRGSRFIVTFPIAYPKLES